MLRLIQWLIFGHVHTWETIDVVSVTEGQRVIGRAIYLRCTECGKHAKQKFVN